jgi:hypothetical protein
LPTKGFAVVVDGLIKTEFETREGATNGARELKGRFAALQIKIYDAGTKSDQDTRQRLSSQISQPFDR